MSGKCHKKCVMSINWEFLLLFVEICKLNRKKMAKVSNGKLAFKTI